VEQMAAAATSLNQQARDLVRGVAAFRIDGANPAPQPSLVDQAHHTGVSPQWSGLAVAPGGGAQLLAVASPQ